ncbi:transcriptional regulator EutR [Anatilimnocola aggregata]|uniref:Transcriptional regulator EutR n=1 Tax=Anatilimnocola aggregata TaxID=2528021 RepID=A0A517YK76_9BACT|nr:helix-turn-helix domain-containing protein [Anatilimnocola aggregata]QDU30623.1 transcriptional regulator EutR [Anatilimnocola aggregata]
MKTVQLPSKTAATCHDPAVTIAEISDPTAVGESIEVIEQDVVQLESKPIRVRRVVVRLGNALVLFHSTNLAVRTRTRLHTDFVAYTAFAPKSIGTVNGLPVSPDRLLACMPGIEVELVVAAGYESVAFLLPPDDIRAHLRSRHREDEFHLPDGIELITPSAADVHGLYRWGRRLIDLATRQPEVFDIQQTRTFANVELIENLLATLRSTVRTVSTPYDLSRQGHSRVVRIAEDFVLSQTAERLHVTDLCEAAGVSERTLQYAFKELMGMTPVAYLTRLRLHQVRKSLRAATHGTTTVTAEALGWGFWHFGDFSRAYKECFGELPSETLRR